MKRNSLWIVLVAVAVICMGGRVSFGEEEKPSEYIKTQSAKALKAKFPFLQKAYSTQEGIWSRGYCVSCIGLDEKEILAYVEHQEKEDKGQLQLTL